jgi:hypothetical protein
MEKSRISFNVAATGPDLCLCVRFDGEKIYDGSPNDTAQAVVHEFDDDVEREHCVEFEMSGKLSDHTQVTESGEIVEDRTILITDVTIDDIELGYLFNQITQYHHDRNGTVDPVIDNFYGVMGCNGRAEFKFSSPVYLWLLENL